MNEVTIIASVVIIYLVYVSMYFNSYKFLSIKEEIEQYTNECNELNRYIEGLKNSYVNYRKNDYGIAYNEDNSRYKYKRKELSKLKNEPNIKDCSLTVLNSARREPIKYICKYFNIQSNEETLSEFENILNSFISVEEGKELLKRQRKKIVRSIIKEVPILIRLTHKETLIRKLGFEEVDFSEVYYPNFKFQYVSAGGNSSQSSNFELNIENLNKLITYLSDNIKYKMSIKGQRALMTSKLRLLIKERDNYTCQICKLSTDDEPHLLLEIDHKIPLSKGGLTTESNLQTLCWKCNRSKGSKVL